MQRDCSERLVIGLEDMTRELADDGHVAYAYSDGEGNTLRLEPRGNGLAWRTENRAGEALDEMHGPGTSAEEALEDFHTVQRSHAFEVGLWAFCHELWEGATEQEMNAHGVPWWAERLVPVEGLGAWYDPDKDWSDEF